MHECQPSLTHLGGAQRQVDRASVDLKLAAGLGRVIAGEDVDQRRFPRPVLPEQTMDLAALHDDAHLVQRLHAAEPL